MLTAGGGRPSVVKAGEDEEDFTDQLTPQQQEDNGVLINEGKR